MGQRGQGRRARHRDRRPGVIGQTGEIAVKVTAPGGELTGLAVTLVQGDSTTPIFDLTPETAADLTTAGDEVSLTRPAGKRVLPDLKAGEAQIDVTAVRPVLFGLRQADRDGRRARSRFG